LLTLLLSMPAMTTAGEILASSVTQVDGRYDVAIRARIDAPSDAVYHAITDYSNLAFLNPDIEVSELLDTTADGVASVRTVIHVCILVFCKRIEQLQQVMQPDANTIEAVTVPDASDFRSGFARWRLSSPTATTTELQFTQTFEPDFWVPPVIGPWLIERKLVSEFRDTSAYIEAQQDNGRP
jgi:hypothetical protein